MASSKKKTPEKKHVDAVEPDAVELDEPVAPAEQAASEPVEPVAAVPVQPVHPVAPAPKKPAQYRMLNKVRVTVCGQITTLHPGVILDSSSYPPGALESFVEQGAQLQLIED